MQLRKVIVSKPVRQEMPSNGTGRVVATYPLVPQGEALFHQFGVGYEEFKTCPGNYTTAVVEWPDGRVESVPVEHVRFVTPNDQHEGPEASAACRRSLSMRQLGAEDGDMATMHELFDGSDPELLPSDTPRVDALISKVMAEHPRVSRTEQAEYYEEVHQHLAPLARELERETDKLRHLLSRLLEEESMYDRGDGNAPGHCHEVPGVWDRDNGKKAGKPCAWCALWAEAKATILTPNETWTKKDQTTGFKLVGKVAPAPRPAAAPGSGAFDDGDILF